jgi:hypothetical protein
MREFVQKDKTIYKAPRFSAAFIGMTSGVAVCICFGFLLVCMKRRNYVQPSGTSFAARSNPTAVVCKPAQGLTYLKIKCSYFGFN